MKRAQKKNVLNKQKTHKKHNRIDLVVSCERGKKNS